MECRKGRRKGAPILGGLLLAWLLTNGRAVVARNMERYDTAYACEGKTLEIECGEGKLIHLIRANYGRFSITICNEHGNTDWSVNCMSPKSFRVLNSECNHRNSCSVDVRSDIFEEDPCPGTGKYIEAQFHCLAATTTTTSRPSPPWFITSQPSVWSTAKPTVRPPSRITTPAAQQPPQQPPAPSTPTLPITTPASPTSTRPFAEIEVDEQDQGLIPPANGSPANGPAIPPIIPETTQATTTSTFSPWRTSRRTTVPSTLYPESSSNGQWYDYGRQVCPPVVARNLSWNTTRAGDIAVQSCPGGANGLARWRCLVRDDTAFWHLDSPDLSECRSVWLTTLENRVSEGDVILGISRELSQVTNNSRGLYGGDMMITAKIIKNMAEKMALDIRTYQDPNQREVSVTELLQGVVRTSSNLLDKSQMASWKDLDHKDQMRVATSLLIGLEENAFLLADTLMHEKTIKHEDKNILMEVRVLDARNIDNELEVFPSEAALQKWTVSNDRVELTRAALLDNSQSGIVRLVFMAFDRLEEILQPQAEPPSVVTNGNSQQRRNATRLLNSKVISASLGKGRHIQLSEPVRVYFRHLAVENVTNPTCVFWDYILSAWSEEGCHIQKTNETHTVCECNHLTNFAVLMDVHAVRLDIAHQVALQIITYIGCIISVVCLILAILTFQLFRGLKSDRTTIHKNLCVCLLIAEVLFVCGIGQTNQRVVCGIVAGLLHFFFLCAFAWMFLEGFQLYVMLIEVFEAEKSRLRWYYLVAYGAPLLVVGISCIIDPLSYGTDQYCWLRADNYFIFSFVGPVLLVILANLVFLTMAIYMMCRHTNTTVAMKSKEHSRLASANGKEENALPNKLQAHLAWLRGAIVLVFLLGLTWTFGLLYLNQESVVMAYIFTVLNSLQGLFIFVFHCVQNEKVRKEYRKFVRRHSWLPKCLRCSKTVTGGSAGSTGGSGGAGGANGGKDFASHNTSSNPSAPTTDSSGLSPHAASNANHYLVSGRSWAIVDRQPAVTVPGEPSSTETHIVATLPYARHAFLPSAPNIPKSATATWGHLNKNLMWKNISFKSYSRDSGHGGSEQEDSPRTHNTLTLGHSGRRRGPNDAGEMNSTGNRTTGGRRAAMPYNHTYTEIVDGRGGNGAGHHQLHAHHGQHVHLPRGLANEDDPVYEEIERGSGVAGPGIIAGGIGGVVGAGEIQVSDMSDEDGRRQSDMSRQSSRSYGDHRPLIPYSPAADRNLPHYGQPMAERGNGGVAAGNLAHYDATEYGPTVERTLNACWEKLRRQQARYELGDLPRLPAAYGMPPQQDHTRTVAVLDGHTVVCHLQPQTDMYTGRGMPPPSYSEC
ncbi:PREDICTED: latrophilin Cirl-like isoform X2 [Dinoponera quadriceps]|uniref:Latrophilin Cirl-like isoform X2 n=1 Tax=Dinoponera quadriceps TaxID=609295 RepID=A0A6P3XMP5_DINQU|nr:PREDICTED: latrophilin Cirl-like isoform X2 [Dinoponera quadriceps]